jgi:tRNA dimethylallyltransferase
MTKQSQYIIVVIGPTASGKSDFAVEFALKHNGEIISADSRQVYKGLDIGTGKITEAEMKGVKHHMLSVYELDEELSVARFTRDALPFLKDILARNKTPIICGGTGQYVDALIYETSLPNVKPNKTLRETLEKKSTAELVAMLKNKDKNRLETIDIHNRVRLVRALEIIDSLGKVPRQESPALRHPTHIYITNPTRELLRTRITRRLEKRLKEGMVEEVEVIMKKGYTSATMKKFGLEYVTIGKYLEGELTLEAMKKELITMSMQYAKRQQTWNKKYKGIAETLEVKE